MLVNVDDASHAFPILLSFNLLDGEELLNRVAHPFGFEREGRLVPVVVVPEAGKENHWVLIDG